MSWTRHIRDWWLAGWPDTPPEALAEDADVRDLPGRRRRQAYDLRVTGVWLRRLFGVVGGLKALFALYGTIYNTVQFLKSLDADNFSDKAMAFVLNFAFLVAPLLYAGTLVLAGFACAAVTNGIALLLDSAVDTDDHRRSCPTPERGEPDA